MFFIININALCFCWMASFCAHLCADKQSALKKPCSKFTAWSFFAALNSLALFLLLNEHHWLVALGLFSFILAYCWVAVALVFPQLSNQKSLFQVSINLTVLITLAASAIYLE